MQIGNVSFGVAMALTFLSLVFSLFHNTVCGATGEGARRLLVGLEGRFGLHDREPETLETLSDRLGLTRERVRQIQNEAMQKLKRHMMRDGIDKGALF